MKTLQEFYTEITASDELKKDFVEEMQSDGVREFLESHDCGASPKEVGEFLAERAAEDSPLALSPEQLSRVAGGLIEASEACTQSAAETCNCSDTCIRDCC